MTAASFVKWLGTHRDGVAILISTLALIVSVLTFLRSYLKERRERREKAAKSAPIIALRSLSIRRSLERVADDGTVAGIMAVQKVVKWDVSFDVSVKNMYGYRCRVAELFTKLRDWPGGTLREPGVAPMELARGGSALVPYGADHGWIEPDSQFDFTIAWTFLPSEIKEVKLLNGTKVDVCLTIEVESAVARTEKISRRLRLKPTHIAGDQPHNLLGTQEFIE